MSGTDIIAPTVVVQPGSPMPETVPPPGAIKEVEVPHRAEQLPFDYKLGEVTHHE